MKCFLCLVICAALARAQTLGSMPYVGGGADSADLEVNSATGGRILANGQDLVGTS